MPAPQLTFSVTGGNKISSVSGYNHISVSFSSDIPYQAFECRATKLGQSYGRGIGELIFSFFTTTPAGVQRTFEIYDNKLINGEGEYRISLYAQSEDGSWNDNYAFIPLNSTGLTTKDSKKFLCMR
jgi:hypothetical protein